MIGIDKRNIFHAKYINDFLEKAKPDAIYLQIPPDLPYFIKTQNSFQKSWQKFIKGRYDYKFFVNPNPNYLADITLSKENIHALVSGPMLQATDSFILNANYLYSHDHITDRFKINSFLTPLIYSYNNHSQNTPIIIGDYPLFKHRHILIEN